ncbi:PD-(D/E)XK nuclease-like domain-containing protein [Inquilinus sp.]|uniref:PD-(D/E)XK nuclease-like domain-containing protein n=1 Tax=Inquilinus sp. TaxID=1932117 RepID=UPI0031DC880A
MTALITEPGVYDGISAEAYHSLGLTPEFALSSSGAREIDATCPAAFWWNSPLNPDREPPRKTEFDIGNATHLLVLQPEEFADRVVEVEADDWRTNAAKAARDEAREDRRIPLLTKQLRMVEAMRDAVLAHPIAGLAFQGGAAEQTIAWRDGETGVWLRCRPDYRPPHRRYLVDAKTTTSAHPRDFERRVLDYGFHMQAAWYLDAEQAVAGERPTKFFFVAVEKEPPFLVAVHEMDVDAIGWGRIQNRRAIRTFAECMSSGRWPGYRDPLQPSKDQAFRISLPGFALRDLEARHERGEFTTNAFERAAAAQAPLQHRDAAE